MASDAANSTNSSWIGPDLAGFCTAPEVVPLFTAYLLILLLCSPVFLCALYFLCRKWKNPQPLSHSDMFTAHTLTMEALNLLGGCAFLHAVHKKDFSNAFLMGVKLSVAGRIGRISFHALICVERYLAAVHPITYLRLKKRGGVVVRNTCIGLAWLLSVGFAFVFTKCYFCFQILSLLLAAVSETLEMFCTASVLCVLIRPGPGEGGGDRKSVSQSKRAALYTMAVILGAQLVDMINSTLFFLIEFLTVTSIDSCLLLLNSRWIELSNSLVLPLLFLHRAKKANNFT